MRLVTDSGVVVGVGERAEQQGDVEVSPLKGERSSRQCRGADEVEGRRRRRRADRDRHVRGHLGPSLEDLIGHGDSLIGGVAQRERHGEARADAGQRGR